MRIALVLGVCLLASAATAAPDAKSGKSQSNASPGQVAREALRERANQNVVTIMTGAPGGTDLSIVQDISQILDDGTDLRIVPMVGNGPAQALKDVLYLRGVDMGVTQANILKYYARNGELGPNLESQVVYVAKLFNEEIHIVARSGVADIHALDGQPVNLGEVGSGTAITGQQMFSALGIKVKEMHLGERDAIEKVKSGEIAATITVAGKPALGLAAFAGSDGLKILSVPYLKNMEDGFYPATLTHADYPALIAEGESVDTVSVCAVLVSFNWNGDPARRRKLAKFTDRFFTNFDALLEAPRHPKWREVNFAATLEGWRRAPAAQSWIDRAKTVADSASQTQFNAFLAEAPRAGAKPISEAERATLFRAFLEWNQSQKQSQN